jgi:hypothetical protein
MKTYSSYAELAIANGADFIPMYGETAPTPADMKTGSVATEQRDDVEVPEETGRCLRCEDNALVY